jgi:quaternary ammonium compound-resistance protein SugE
MRATQTIPLGTSYAVWTGIGDLGAAVVGIVFFMEPVKGPHVFSSF